MDIGKMRRKLKRYFVRHGLHIFSHTSLYFRLFIITFVVFMLTTLAIAFQLENHLETAHIEVVKDELKSIAAITAVHMDGDAVELLQNPAQEEGPLYRQVQQALQRVMGENPKINDIYIMRKGSQENQVIFVVDAAVEEHAALGEQYDANIAPNMLEGFEHPSVDDDYTSDKWGQTLSGYAPVRNKQQEVIGIVGVDYDASSIKKELEMQRKHVLIYSAFGILCMLVVSAFVGRKLIRRLDNIKHVLDMLLEENLDVAVHDTGRDEIKALALSVNKLTKKLAVDKEQMFMASITGLVNALEAKDEYTHGHSAEVAAIAKDIMQAMRLDEEEQFDVHFAAILHDIGKIGVSDAVLHKPGNLTAQEFDSIKEHPIIGAKILSGIPSLDKIQQLVRHHHERYDGKGYPDGLLGQQILLGSRIIAVADSFQAMISDRPYRKGMSQAAAMQELERNKGTQFDPAVVDLFLAICQKKNYTMQSPNG